MHPHIPKKWLEKWAYDNPKQALVVCLLGIGMYLYVIWLMFADALGVHSP